MITLDRPENDRVVREVFIVVPVDVVGVDVNFAGASGSELYREDLVACRDTFEIDKRQHKVVSDNSAVVGSDHLRVDLVLVVLRVAGDADYLGGYRVVDVDHTVGGELIREDVNLDGGDDLVELIRVAAVERCHELIHVSRHDLILVGEDKSKVSHRSLGRVSAVGFLSRDRLIETGNRPYAFIKRADVVDTVESDVAVFVDDVRCVVHFDHVLGLAFEAGHIDRVVLFTVVEGLPVVELSRSRELAYILQPLEGDSSAGDCKINLVDVAVLVDEQEHIDVRAVAAGVPGSRISDAGDVGHVGPVDTEAGHRKLRHIDSGNHAARGAVDQQQICSVRRHEDVTAHCVRETHRTAQVGILNYTVADEREFHRILIEEIQRRLLSRIAGCDVEIVVETACRDGNGLVVGFFVQFLVLGNLSGVDGGDPDVAGLIPDNAVEFLLDRENPDRDGVAHFGSHGSRCGDINSGFLVALVYAGDKTLAVHDSDALIGGGPEYGLVRVAPRPEVVAELEAALVDDGQFIIIGDLNRELGILELFGVEVDLVGRQVESVVVNLDKEVRLDLFVAKEFGEVELVVVLLALADIRNGSVVVEEVAVLCVESDRGDVLLVVCGNREDRAAFGSGRNCSLFGDLCAYDERSRAVNNERKRYGGEFLGHLRPVDIALIVQIVLGSRAVCHREGITGLKFGHRNADVEHFRVVVPVARVRVVVRRVLGAEIGRDQVSAVLVGHLKPGGAGVPDEGVPEALKDSLGADGVALGHILGIEIQRVAAEIVFGAVGQLRDVALVVEHLKRRVNVSGHCVDRAAHVRQSVFFFEHELNVGALVEHVVRGPVAVEAEHRNGVSNSNLALFGAALVHEDVTFNVILVSANSAERSVEVADSKRDDGVALSGFGIGGSEVLKRQFRVVGVYIVVFVKVGCKPLVFGVEFKLVINEISQEPLGVKRVRDSVAVEVVEVRIGGFKFLAVNGPLEEGFNVNGLVEHALGVEFLREEVSGETELDGLLAHVVNGELDREVVSREGAELDLDLAVGNGLGRGLGRGVDNGVDGDVGLGIDRRVNVGNTCALLHDRGVLIGPDRMLVDVSRRHEKAGDKRSRADVKLLGEAVVFNVLRQNSGETRDLRRRHGGAAVAYVVCAGSLLGGIALYGQDVAAGCGDLRLKREVAGNAPGREVAHHVLAFAGVGVPERSFVVKNVAVVILNRIREEVLENVSVVSLNRNRGNRDVRSKRRKVHADHAGLVVRDNDRDGAEVVGRGNLLNE